MMKHLDFEGLGRELLARWGDLLPGWLPGGRLIGREFVCGGLRGGPGDSFRVNTEKGAWAEFSGDLKGGDLISLYAAIEGIRQGEAAKKLAAVIGYALQTEPEERRAARAPADVLGLPPTDAPEPDFRHPVHSWQPATVWQYRTADARPWFYVVRYDPPNGKKEFSPWSWSTTRQRWVMKSHPAPRPLYGLDLLAAKPDAPVLIVEGEKAAEAARQITKLYVVVTWPNGSKAADKVDWAPLKGRRVLIWPDADRHAAKDEAEADKYGVEVSEALPYGRQPGPAAAAAIAAILLPICTEVKIIDVGYDADRVDGWDAADALAEGWDWPRFAGWAKPRAKVINSPAGATGSPAGLLNAPVNAAAVAVASDGAKATAAVQVHVSTEERSVESKYDVWDQLGIALTNSGSPIANVDNALRVLEKHADFKDLLWYDAFHSKYFTRFKSDRVREWTDIDELNIAAFMQRDLAMPRISDEMVHKASVIYGRQRQRTEPRDWLEKLKWDEMSRLDCFFIDFFGAQDSPYVRAVGRNFWIGMIARIFQPGCQLDNMVVLEGAQGIGKTRALRIMGGNWYTEAHESVTNKDFFMVLDGKLIVEIAELDSFSRAEVTRIKQVVSCTTDRYRAPYARSVEDHPRSSIFVGTTNEQAYLRDNTGGRRFWPIGCGAIDHALLAQHRDQLYAEAVHRYKAGETWYEMPPDYTAQQQEQRRQVDEWEPVIETWLKNQLAIEHVSIRDIAVECLKIEIGKLDRAIQMRIGAVLRHLGWSKVHKSVNGAQQKLWEKQEVLE